MRRLALAGLLVATVAGPAHAQVQARIDVGGIDIGIHLGGPPALTVIPGAPVYYAPQAPENIFFYAHQYWAFAGAGWYVAPTWNGPWAVVEPVYVPAPILQIPVAYYHVPPGHWKEWRREAPPRWEEHYGREWHEEPHERGWREREEHWTRGEGRGCPPGLAKQGRC